MSNIGLVMSAGIKSGLRQKMVAFIMVPITLMIVVGVALIFCLLLIGPEMDKPFPDRNLLEGYLNLILYSCVIISIGVTVNSMIYQTLIKEKERGSLAALLSTPLTPRDIWLGQSLAIFIPGLVIGLVLALISLIVVNVIYFIPDIGFLFSWQMVISSLIALPLLYLFFGMLVYLMGFISKAGTANIVAQVFLPVMVNVAAQLVAQGVMTAVSWQFMVLNIGIAAVIGVLVLIFKSKLTPERVVLSG